MGTINMVETIKQIHKEDVVLVKIGTFYNAFGKDAYVLSYLFNYKLSKVQNTYTAAFPTSSLNKIRVGLEDNKVNYIIVDRRNNYDVEDECINKKQNNYIKIFEESKVKINTQNRIDRITKYLQENPKIIEELEKTIVEYERRKI